MKWIRIKSQFLDTLSKIFSHKYISWYQVNHLVTWAFEMVEINHLIRDRESECYKWYCYSPSNITCPISLKLVLVIFLSLFLLFANFFLPLLSSSNCRIYKYKIDIRSSPNSERDQGPVSFFRKGRSLFLKIF